MDKKGISGVALGLILVGVIIVVLLAGPMVKLVKTGMSFLFSLEEEENPTAESIFFATPYVGTYYNNKFGETTQNCTKSGNNYNCKPGTSVEFYVGVMNKGEKKRYFYPAPCIIKDYEKDDKCEASDYLLSYKPCGVDSGNTNATNCLVGRGFILETGTYRVFPGAKCLPEDCYNPENPTTNNPKANYDSFFEITVK